MMLGWGIGYILTLCRQWERCAQANLVAAVEEFVADGAAPAERMIRDLVACEHSYINTDHPAFIGGSRAIAQARPAAARRRPLQALQVSRDGGGSAWLQDAGASATRCSLLLHALSALGGGPVRLNNGPQKHLHPKRVSGIAIDAPARRAPGHGAAGGRRGRRGGERLGRQRPARRPPARPRALLRWPLPRSCARLARAPRAQSVKRGQAP